MGRISAKVVKGLFPALSLFVVLGAAPVWDRDPSFSLSDRNYGQCEEHLTQLVLNRQNWIHRALASADSLTIEGGATWVIYYLTKSKPGGATEDAWPAEDIAVVLDGAIPLLFRAMDLDLYHQVEGLQRESVEELMNKEVLQRLSTLFYVMDALITLRMYMEKWFAADASDESSLLGQKFKEWRAQWDVELERALSRAPFAIRDPLRRRFNGESLETQRRVDELMQRVEEVLIDAEANNPVDALASVRATIQVIELSNVPEERKQAALSVLKPRYASMANIYFQIEFVLASINSLFDDVKGRPAEVVANEAPFTLARLEFLKKQTQTALMSVEFQHVQVKRIVEVASSGGEPGPLSFERAVRGRTQLIQREEMSIRSALLEGDFDAAESMLNEGIVDSVLLIRRLRRIIVEPSVREFLEGYLQRQGLK